MNPDLIHRAEETPDTVLTLIDGSRYVVTQSLGEIVDLVVGFRARVVAEAGRLAQSGELSAVPELGLRAVGSHDDDDDDDPDAHDLGDVVRLRSRRA